MDKETNEPADANNPTDGAQSDHDVYNKGIEHREESGEE